MASKMASKVLRLSMVVLSAAAVMSLVGSSVAVAQNEESEEARQAAEKAKRRRYPGGRDEQELTVQAVIPVTTRYPVDPKPAVAGGEKAAPVDEGHD